MSNALFCDLSAWNANPASIDWHAYKQWSASGDGVSRVALRSSYGVGYVDQHFAAYRDAALKAGIDVLLLYHYAYPQDNAPQAEADWQRKVVGSVRASDILMVDMEEQVSQATASWAYDWLARQEQNYGGKLPGVYASDAYIRARFHDNRLARYPLWLAAWTFSPENKPACPPPWSHYTYWQFTDKLAVPGIPGTVDANIALGGTPPMTTTSKLTIELASNYFELVDSNHWRCKQTGYILQYGILDYFCSLDPTHVQGDYYGISILQYPTSNEQPVSGLPGVVLQRFVGGVVAYDPKGQLSRPAGVKGACYVYTVESLYKALDQFSAANKQLTSDKAALQSQLTTAQQQSQQAQAQLQQAAQHITQVETANAQLQASVAQLTADKAALTAQLADAQQKSDPNAALYTQFVSDVRTALAKVPVTQGATQ